MLQCQQLAETTIMVIMKEKIKHYPITPGCFSKIKYETFIITFVLSKIYIALCIIKIQQHYIGAVALVFKCIL